MSAPEDLNDLSPAIADLWSANDQMARTLKKMRVQSQRSLAQGHADQMPGRDCGDYRCVKQLLATPTRK